MSSKDEIDKGRFLTSAQRGYLMGDHRPGTKNAEYQTRSKIRRRTTGAIKDLGFVCSLLPKKDTDDAKLLFEEWENLSMHNRLTMPGLGAGVFGLIRLAYCGYRQNGMEADQFVSWVALALSQGHADLHDVDPNDVVIDLELNTLEVYPDRAEMGAVEKVEKGLPLTVSEWQELGERLSDEIGRDVAIDECEELVKEHLIDG